VETEINKEPFELKKLCQDDCKPSELKDWHNAMIKAMEPDWRKACMRAAAGTKD
jgi:hypothetical protein